LLDEGGEIVMFACTGLTSIGLAADVRRRWNVPVVDAVRATGNRPDLRRRDLSDRPAIEHPERPRKGSLSWNSC
jgi:hypothetical protein